MGGKADSRNRFGSPRTALREFDAAEQEYRRAAVAPSLKPVRKLALFLAARCAWATGVAGKTRVVPAAADRIREYYRQLLAAGDLLPYFYPQTAQHAVEIGDSALATQVALAHRQHRPEDPVWRFGLARAARARGDYFTALRLFDEIRANKPPAELAAKVDAEDDAVRAKAHDQAKRIIGP